MKDYKLKYAIKAKQAEILKNVIELRILMYNENTQFATMRLEQMQFDLIRELSKID